MIVYHASYTIVENIDLKYCRKSTDFSLGFYITPLKTQAKKWAYKNKLARKQAYINFYDFHETELGNYKVKKFVDYSLEWLDFIEKCRNGLDDTDYDVVIGPIADDKIYDTLTLYSSGLLNKEEAILRLIKNEPNNQICIRTNDAIKNLLKFKGCEKYDG